MKHTASIILFVMAFCGNAHAAEYELRAGSWQLHEGIGVGTQAAGRSDKNICVKPGETGADVDWFVSLAQPRPDCTRTIVSHNSRQIRVNFSCPMNGHTLKGPSTITLNTDRITIRNDLALDLPFAPLAMGQSKTVSYISSQCN